MEASNNTVDRMASYDFKAPIDIIVVFEENSNDKVDLTSSPKSKNEESTKIVTDIDLNNTENEVNINKSSDPKDNEKEVRKLKSVAESKKRKINEENSQSVLNNDDTFKRTKTCITNPNNQNNVSDGLKSISKYLTLILEYLNHYMKTVNNVKSIPHDVTLAKKSFLTIKYHFFKAAYEHVNSHILPYENNQAFIHNFLNYTIDIATKRLKFDCNKGVTEMYFELMKWVKQRKYKDFSDSCKTPTLLAQLNNPPIIPDVTISESSIIPIERSSTKSDQDKFCIFSSGPPGRQVNINIDKSLVTNNTQVPRNINTSPKNPNLLPQNTNLLQQQLITPQNFPNMIPQSHNFSFRNTNDLVNTNGDRQVDSEFVARQHNLTLPIGLENEYLITAENRIQHYPPPSSRQRSLFSENNQVRVIHNSQSNAYYKYYHTTNNFQNNTYYGANSITHGRNELIPNVAIYEDGHALRRDYNDYNLPRMDMRVPPPPYHSPVAVHSSQMMQPVTTIPTVLPGLPSGPDLTRSSVSTDSGFVSPVQSKSTSNPLEDIMGLMLSQPTLTPDETAPAIQSRALIPLEPVQCKDCSQPRFFKGQKGLRIHQRVRHKGKQNDLFELVDTTQPPKEPARTATQVTCHVCHQNAKLMCSACFKTSYCNTKCQKLDWELHRRICPPPENTIQ